MFRIITHIKGSLPKYRAAVHATPRRYKYLSSAISAAQGKKGLHGILNDLGEVHAVVKDGKLLGRRQS